MTAQAPRSRLPAPAAARVQQLAARWQALAARERRLVGAAAVLLLGLAIWLTLLGPALRTLRGAPARLEQLESAVLRQRALAVEAATLRNTPPVSAAQAANALNTATERLGTAGRLVVQGERASLQLTGVEAPALQAWLAEARSAARARPVEMQLTRGQRGLSGSVVVSLGAGG